MAARGYAIYSCKPARHQPGERNEQKVAGLVSPTDVVGKYVVVGNMLWQASISEKW